MLKFSLAICLKLLWGTSVGERSPSFRRERWQERRQLREREHGSDKRSHLWRRRQKKESAIGNKTIHHAATDLGGQVIASLSHKNEWTWNVLHKSKRWIFVETASERATFWEWTTELFGRPNFSASGVLCYACTQDTALTCSSELVSHAHTHTHAQTQTWKSNLRPWPFDEVMNENKLWPKDQHPNGNKCWRNRKKDRVCLQGSLCPVLKIKLVSFPDL